MTSRGGAVPRGDGQRGLTLLELVIALALLGAVLGGGIYAFVASGTRSARQTNEFLQSQAQLRAALDGILDETRWGQSVVAASLTAVTLLIPAGSPFNGGASYTVTFAYDAAADTVTRQVDPDGAGLLPPGPATPVAYTIVRDDGSDGVAFAYFDNTGAVMAVPPVPLTDVVRIRATLTATRGTISRTLTDDAALRGR